jgi:DNA-binding MarR family transcriptional regulator
LESKIEKLESDDIKLTRNQRDILNLFEDKNEWGSSEIAVQLNLNIETTKKNLKILVDQGYLIKHGKTKGAWYRRK